METYERLCHHFNSESTPLTPEAYIDADIKLKPQEKDDAKLLAKEVDEAFKGRMTTQRLHPEVAAAIALVETTNQSIMTVAKRYRVDPGNLRNKLKTWRTNRELANEDKIPPLAE